MDETTISLEQEQTSDSFLEGWDEADSDAFTAYQQETEEEAPAAEAHAEPDAQQEEQGAEAAAEQPAAEAQPQEEQKVDAPKQWSLRHMGEVKSVGEEELVTLAQKGMDYDRIRGKYDESKPVMELFGQFARQANMSIPEYVAHIRMQAKQAEGMSEAEARRTVELEDREAVVSAHEAERQAMEQANADKESAESRRKADIAEFQKLFPDAAKDPKSIPPEVWESVRNGMNLTTAYAIYDAKKARAAQAAAEQKAVAAEQNHTNATRATGSMQGSGENRRSRDPFLEGWDA